MRNFVITVVLFLVAADCAAQGYLPIRKPTAEAVTREAGALYQFLANPDSYTCKPEDIPTAESLKTKEFRTTTKVITGSQAAKLNLPWGSGTFDAKQLYAIADTSRFGVCLAKDGKTTVRYGQVIRTIIQMNDYKVDANSSIAVVAAAATVERKTNSVELSTIGFGSTELQTMLVDARGLVQGSGVNIDNYSEFIKAFNAAERFAASLPNPGVEVIGVAVPTSSEDINRSLAMSWALAKIAGGWGCEDAIRRFKSQGSAYADAINSVYSSVAGGCGVDDVGKAKAKQLLNGLKILYLF